MRRSPVDGLPLPDGTREVLLAVLVVSSALVAGCSAFDGQTDTKTADETISATQPSPASTDTVRQSLDDRGIDPDAVWNRTERLLGVNATQPQIRVADHPPGSHLGDLRYLDAYAGAEESDDESTVPGWYDSATRTVYLTRSTLTNATREGVESTLAHEYVHAIQHQRGWWTDEDLPTPTNTTRQAHIEGFARYAQIAYLLRHTVVEPDLDRALATYQQYDVRRQVTLAPYFYGWQYFHREFEEPSTVWNDTAAHPATTEQVLHDTDEGPRSLRLRMNVTESRSERHGEITTRLVLGATLNWSRASDAAAGWGNDRMLRVGSTNDTVSGYIWIQRWDSSAEADEFAVAARDHLANRRAETDDYRFRFVRIDDDRTVLLAGNEALLESVAFETPSNETVRVSLAG